MRLLDIKSLSVSVENKQVLRGLNLRIERGEVHLLMGANGSGKSSLANIIMGNANYKVTANQQTNKSSVNFEGKDLLEMSADQRARAGVFVVWQNPVAIPGVNVFSLCKAGYESQGKTIGKLTEFKQKLEELAMHVGLSSEHISRGVNEGFSGGERKRLELLQLLLLAPKLAIIDEIDSGLDAKGIQLVVETINTMKQAGTSFILITHNKTLLTKVLVDKIWEMNHGTLSAGV